MSDRKFYLGIAVVVITAWMFRWQVIPSSGADNAAALSFKIDRFNGITYYCAADNCTEHKHLDD